MLEVRRLKAVSWAELHGLHGRWSEEGSSETVDHCDRCCCQHRYTVAEEVPEARGLQPVREDPGVSLRGSLVHLEVHLEVRLEDRLGVP